MEELFRVDLNRNLGSNLLVPVEAGAEAEAKRDISQQDQVFPKDRIRADKSSKISC